MTKRKLFGFMSDCVSVALILMLGASAYAIVCLALNEVVPCIIATTMKAHDFWFVGIPSLAFCGGAFALFKSAREPSTSRTRARVFIAIGVLLEAGVFVSAIIIWVEAVQYAAWVKQFGEITVSSGADVRYWIAAVLFANGIAANLIGFILTRPVRV